MSTKVIEVKDHGKLPKWTVRYTGELEEAVGRFQRRFGKMPAMVYRWSVYWCFEVEGRYGA